MIRTITEIVGRSDQGVIRPFICRCDNGSEYFVKGSTAGRRACICEWVASSLAARFGLPVPPISLVEVDRSLIVYGGREDLKDLGAGVWFGSLSVPDVIELPYSVIPKIDPVVRATVLLFDWWVLNGDRNFGPDGGNPNLLWDARRERVHVIDHNLAFETDFAVEFWKHHVFHEDRRLWTRQFREETQPKMITALEEVDEYWNAMPELWYEDAQSSALTRFVGCCDGVSGMIFGGTREGSRLQLCHCPIPPISRDR